MCRLPHGFQFFRVRGELQLLQILFIAALHERGELRSQIQQHSAVYLPVSPFEGGAIGLPGLLRGDLHHCINEGFLQRIQGEVSRNRDRIDLGLIHAGFGRAALIVLAAEANPLFANRLELIFQQTPGGSIQLLVLQDVLILRIEVHQSVIGLRLAGERSQGAVRSTRGHAEPHRTCAERCCESPRDTRCSRSPWRCRSGGELGANRGRSITHGLHSAILDAC